MKYFCISLVVLFIACDSKNDHQTRLTGNLNEDVSDTLYVSDFARSAESQDTIAVVGGKFYYTLETPVPDIRNVQSKSRRIKFDFISLPGDVHVDFESINYTIDGELNNEIKKENEKITNLLKAKQSLFFLQGKAATTNDSMDFAQKEVELNNVIKSTLLSITQKHSNNIVSGVSAWASQILLPKDTEFYDTLFSRVDHATLNQTTLGELLKKYRNQRTLPTYLPEALLYNESIEEIDFSQIFSDYTFVDFWASWCAPCRAEIPKLKELYSKYDTNDKINFISISKDSKKDNWINALEVENMPWQQYIVKNKANNEILSNHWGIVGIPFGILIGPEKTTIVNNIKSAQQLESILHNLEI